MPPQRDLKALAKAAGMTKQQYVAQEKRDQRRMKRDSGRQAVVDQRRKELYIEEQRILRNDPTWTPATIEVQPEVTEGEIITNGLRAICQAEWEILKGQMDAGEGSYICSTSKPAERMNPGNVLTVSDEWSGMPYTMMRHEDAMGKEEGLLKMGEWEKKGWLKKHRSQHVFDHPVRGHAFACYCEEQLQLLAAQHEWEVLGVRRCLHSVPGSGFARTGPLEPLDG